jgi:fructuronate reductase
MASTTQAQSGSTRRLSDSNLSKVGAEVLLPQYGRDKVSIGVVHLGLGNFHRAHQAVYFEKVLNRGDLRWGISAISLKRPVTRDALQPQDFLYTVLTRSGAATQAQVIGAIRECLVAPESPAAVIERLAHADTKLVSLTITEKGYLETGEASALGYLLKALELRMNKSLPVTILSCDNLSSNGERLHLQLIAKAKRLSPQLATWIERHVTCPNTMVDRIVPATLDQDRQEAKSCLGLEDAWPVPAEPFTQWVIENRFANEMPGLSSVGVQLVESCAPYEAMKLRLLNAGHSAMAYLGAPAGFKTVDQVVATPQIRAFLRRLWSEAARTLPDAVQAEVPAYVRALETRFSNPALGHRLAQIAMDGSLKVPVRLLATLRDCRAAHLPSDAIIFAVAAWIRWLRCHDEAGQSYELKDPMAALLIKLSGPLLTAQQRVRQLMELEPVFGLDLGSDAELAISLTHGLERLENCGSLEAVSHDFK